MNCILPPNYLHQAIFIELHDNDGILKTLIARVIDEIISDGTITFSLPPRIFSRGNQLSKMQIPCQIYAPLVGDTSEWRVFLACDEDGMKIISSRDRSVRV